MDVPVKSNSDGGEEKGEESDDVTVDSENDPSEDREMDVGNEKEEKEKNDGTTGKENDIEILKVTQGTGQIIKHNWKEKWIHKRRARLQMEKCSLMSLSMSLKLNMLHNQFPLCEGLEDTSLGTTFQYSVSGENLPRVFILDSATGLLYQILDAEKE